MKLHGAIQTGLVAASAMSAVASAAFFFLYYSLYWQHRDRFNEIGRYMRESDVVVYQEQNGILIFPACVLAVMAVVFLIAWRLRRRSAERNRGKPQP